MLSFSNKPTGTYNTMYVYNYSLKLARILQINFDDSGQSEFETLWNLVHAYIIIYGALCKHRKWE